MCPAGEAAKAKSNKHKQEEAQVPGMESAYQSLAMIYEVTFWTNKYPSLISEFTTQSYHVHINRY